MAKKHNVYNRNQKKSASYDLKIFGTPGISGKKASENLNF